MLVRLMPGAQNCYFAATQATLPLRVGVDQGEVNTIQRSAEWSCQCGQSQQERTRCVRGREQAIE